MKIVDFDSIANSPIFFATKFMIFISIFLRLLEARSNNISTCQEAKATTHVQQKIVRDYLPLLAATLAIFVVLAILIIVAFIYRDEVRVWLHSRYGVRFFQRIDDLETSDKIFDAFLSYRYVNILVQNFITRWQSPYDHLNKYFF